MDKVEAIMVIVSEGQKIRATNTGAKRVFRALKILGLEQQDVIRVLCYLDYCKPDGTPYNADTKRIW